MRSAAFILSCVLISLAGVTSAFADDIAAHRRAPREMTLSGSILLLSARGDDAQINMVELTGEWRLGEHFGVAGIAGAGRIISRPGDVEYRFSALDLGGQFHYYLLGNFEHGMQIGAEALVIGMQGRDQYNGSMDVRLGVVMAGPYLGYKIVTPTGFTALVQAGAAAVATSVDATHEPTEMEFSDTAAHLAPLVNLNLGWSF